MSVVESPPRFRAPVSDRRVKRVLYVNHTAQMSGAELSLLLLLRGLPDEVSPVVACPEGELADAVRELGVTVEPIRPVEVSLKPHPVFTSRALLEIGRLGGELAGLSHRVGADLLHANSIRAGLSSGLARQLGAAPGVVQVHDCLPPSKLSSLSLRVIASQADAILANSRYTLNTLPAHRAADHVVYNPVDLKEFAPPDRDRRRSVRASLGLSDDTTVLAVVAQITPWKGQDDAIRILARLRAEGQDVRLLIIGSPKFTSKATRYDNVRYDRGLRELTDRLGVSEHVRFLGQRGDVPALMSAVDVLLVPSWEEPFGRVIIEAMAMSVPVVATEVGGPAEVIDDGVDGVLLPPREPERWARELSGLIGEPARRLEMAERGRTKVAAEYSLETYVEDVLDVYAQVADRAHGEAARRRRARLPLAPPPAASAPERLRVLYVNHTSTVSGGERSLLILLRSLPPEVSAVVACPDGTLAEAVRRLGVPVVPMPGTEGSLKLHPEHTPRALAQIVRASSAIRAAARREACDIVHANTIRSGLMCGLARLRGGPPVVVHIRDCLPEGIVSTLTLRFIARTATAMIANSSYTREHVAATIGPRAIDIAHSPVDLQRFDPGVLSRDAARSRLGLPASPFLLGIIGQITPWKGQEDALRMLADLSRRRNDVHLLVVGSAKFVSHATRYDNLAYLERLRALVRSLDLEERVFFLGEREDVPEILRALDLLLVPSWQEPFGRTVAEAMAMGVPVLATDVGGPAEVLREGEDGHLLPPRSPAIWSRAVERLLEDRDGRERMAANSRARVEADFGAQAHTREVLRAYRSVFGPNGSGPAEGDGRGFHSGNGRLEQVDRVA